MKYYRDGKVTFKFNQKKKLLKPSRTFKKCFKSATPLNKKFAYILKKVAILTALCIQPLTILFMVRLINIRYNFEQNQNITSILLNNMKNQIRNNANLYRTLLPQFI